MQRATGGDDKEKTNEVPTQAHSSRRHSASTVLESHQVVDRERRIFVVGVQRLLGLITTQSAALQRQLRPELAYMKEPAPCTCCQRRYRLRRKGSPPGLRTRGSWTGRQQCSLGRRCCWRTDGEDEQTETVCQDRVLVKIRSVRYALAQQGQSPGRSLHPKRKATGQLDRCEKEG